MPRLLLGLRGISLVLIVVAQLAGARLLPREFGSGLDEVGLMVMVVISGFGLAAGHADRQFDRAEVIDFLVHRAVRVLPAYVVAIVMSLAIARWWAVWPYRFDSAADVVRALLLLDAPGPLWIVPVVLQCYAIFLAAWFLWAINTPAWVLILAALATIIPVCAGWYPDSGHGLAVVTPVYSVAVGLGFAWQDFIEPFLVRHLGMTSVVGGLSFVALFLNLPAFRANHGWTLGESVVASTWFDPVTIAITIALALAAAARPIALAVLGAAPLAVLGERWLAGYLLAPVLLAAVSI